MSFDTNDLAVYKGSDFTRTFQPNTVDDLPYPVGNGYAEMQVRLSEGDPIILLYLTSDNGGLLVDPNRHTVTVRIPATQTALMNFTQGVYDLFVTPVGGVRTLVSRGGFGAIASVTRVPTNRVRASVTTSFTVQQDAGRVQSSVTASFFINR